MRRIGIGVLALTLMICVALGCGSDDDDGGGGAGSSSGPGPAIPEGPITLGFTVGKTGAMAFYDLPIQQGIDKAVEEINADGGVLGHQLRVIETDAKSDPALSGSAAAKLISEGADVLIPMNDYDLGSPAQREAQNQGVLTVTAAGSPLTNLVGDKAYTVTSTTPVAGTAAATFASDKGYSKAYLLMDTAVDFSKSWCKAFRESFEAEGGTIVGEDTYQTGDQSVASQVTRLRGKGDADVIALCGFPPTGATAIKQIRSADVDLPIVTTSSFSVPVWLEAAPGVSDVYAVGAPGSLYGDDPDAKVNAFFKSLPKPPTADYAVYGYSIVEAIAEAINRAKSVDGEALAAVVNDFKDVPLLVGPTTYSEDCRLPVGRPAKVIEFQNGKGAYMESVTPSNVKYPEGITCP